MRPQRKRLTLGLETAGGWLLGGSLLGLLVFAPGCRRAPPPAASVVVMVIDTLRPDRMGCYGAARDTSPAMDALAREGVLFERAFTVAPSTWQSFVSILTGLNPPRHGVRFIFDDPLPATTPTLASILGARGYATASFDVIPFMRWMTGGHGFASYVDTESERHGTLRDAELADRIVAWIAARRPDERFFLFVRFHGPHWRYTPKPELHDLFGSDAGADHAFNEGDYGVAFDTARAGDRQVRLVDAAQRRALLFERRLSPAAHTHMLVHYDAAVRTVDEQVGRVVEALRTADRLGTTMVVLTSDHGESFGERGYYQHGPRVDEAVMRVPLIVRFPGRMPHGRPGQRVAQLVRTIDVAPTVLRTLAVEPPAPMQGMSLLPAVDGDTDLGLIAYGETGGEFVEVDDQLHAAGVAGKHRMLRTARWKLVHVPDGAGGGAYHLHDMAGRGEDENVAAAHPAELTRLRQLLDAVIDADPDLDREATPRPLTAEEREHLRALGYAP